MKYFLALLLSLSLSSNLWAEDYDPEKIIKYRQDFMTAVKGHNNDIKAIVNDTVPFENHLDMHLSALEQQFNEISSLFPEGSDFGDTNAKDGIWENPQKFKQAVDKAQQALNTFKQVAAQGDKAETRKAFKTFGRNSCGSCHKSFKKKSKK